MGSMWVYISDGAREKLSAVYDNPDLVARLCDEAEFVRSILESEREQLSKPERIATLTELEQRVESLVSGLEDLPDDLGIPIAEALYRIGHGPATLDWRFFGRQLAPLSKALSAAKASKSINQPKRRHHELQAQCAGMLAGSVAKLLGEYGLPAAATETNPSDAIKALMVLGDDIGLPFVPETWRQHLARAKQQIEVRTDPDSGVDSEPD
jgi:hypothetical protein